MAAINVSVKTPTSFPDSLIHNVSKNVSSFTNPRKNSQRKYNNTPDYCVCGTIVSCRAGALFTKNLTTNLGKTYEITDRFRKLTSENSMHVRYT